MKSPKQLCSAQCCLGSAETKWRSNHELALLCLSRYSSIRQGGIVSPYLFYVYLDDFSIALSACRTGCCVGNSLINHLMYADDLVIFSPSSIGLRALITVCEEYAVSHDMLFNHKKSVSQGFHVTNGVRQGGILSPYLFYVYLDDLSIALSACRTGCCVGNSLINHLMYADDLVIFSPSSIGLRALITVCEEYAVSHEMLFNHKKSVILICRSKYMKNVYPVFTLNVKIVDESDTARYLGHIICNSGKDDKDIMRQCQQLYARGNALFRKFHMCSMSVKIQLFNTYCSPMYTKEMKLIRKPSPMLPMVIQLVVAPPSGHSVMHPVQAGAELVLWQVVFTSLLITTSK